MAQLDVGELLGMNPGHLLAPQQPAFHHVGLLDRAQPVAALAREIEGDAGDALDLGRGVDLGVDAAALAIRQRLDAARLAEIDPAGEFADDQDIQSGDQLGLERGRLGERGEHDRRAQIGEQLEVLPEPQQAGLGPDVEIDTVPLGSAAGAQQHRVGLHRRRQRRLGQRHAMGVDGGAADQILGDVEGRLAGTRHPVDHAADLAHHFGADAVARQEQ